ncbi:MAG: ABC transporter permease [Gammaproteobacteria bacterium]|nr:ABC transporter permease [Gammaproteobacteria bacterium]
MKTKYLHKPLSQTNAKSRSFFKKASTRDLLYIGYGSLVVLLVLLSYLAGAFSWLPHDPDEMNLDLMMADPFVAGHLLGTDFMGRDLFSRLVLGIQAYFIPGLMAIVIALSLGTFLGVLAGYEGGKVDRAATYINNLLDSIPRMVLILLVVALFKPDVYYIMFVVGVTAAPVVALQIKNKIIYLKQKNFIESAIAIGLPKPTIIFKHILWHNCRSILIIQASLCMAEAILIETSLSYLGFGVQEPIPSWGNMVQAGANYLMQGHLWPSTAPALAILFTILGFYLLADGLNKVLEEKQ